MSHSILPVFFLSHPLHYSFHGTHCCEVERLKQLIKNSRQHSHWNMYVMNIFYTIKTIISILDN